jgi:superfamily I DNA and/or RNA helicase
LASAGETHLPLAKLLHPVGNGRWDYFSPTRIKDEEFILLNHDSIDGVRYQRAFVETALGTRDIAILDGPPGSGKTTTLVELILQLIGRGKRVLMVASTHVAVDNVLERIEDACSDDNMIDSFGVIPLRIGSEANVSDRAAKYLVRNIVATERERIRAELERIERSEAQEAFYQYLKEDPKRHSALEELVIDTANLVCGTTIGVLQADLIKNSRGEAVFDCLILDEASKTTFQEFIVPAMHARRWILSGDVRQLAPYVDSDPTVANLAAITSVNEGFAPRERRMALAILYAFEYLSRKREPIRIVLDDDLVPKAEAQVKALNHLAKGEYRKIIHRVLGQEGNGAELLLIPRSSGRNGQRMNGRTWDADDLPSTWEEEVEWRIKRMFEMRHEPKGHRRYRSQLRMLLPHYDRKVKEKVESRIEDIRRMTLPSVLELIQSGFERDMGAKSEIPLFNGMPEDDLSRRLITLRYQHRMHPEISSLPAREVYESKALRDPDGIEERRAWSYGRYRSRSAWIDVRPGKRDITNGTSNHNRAEARRVVEEIAAFLHWAPKGRRWSVGVLTPYRSQESMIVEELSRRSSALGLKRTNRSFSSSDVEVEVCTVDRYQGHEADVVLLSMVRAKGMPVGHMDSLNRLNVAITRARYQLVVIGDRENFLRNPRAPELLRALANESAVIRGDGGRS